MFGRPLRPEVSGLPGHQVQAQEAGQKLGNVEATHVRKPGKLKILVLPTVKLAQGKYVLPLYQDCVKRWLGVTLV